MPVWRFAPTSRQVAGDTADLAFDLGLYIVDDLPMTGSTSTTITYAGPLSIVSPTAQFVFTIKGQNLSTVGPDVTGGTINQLNLTIAGATYVSVTGLSLSAAQFDDLAIPDFNSTVLLENLLLAGNDKVYGTGLADRLNGKNGNDRLVGNAGADQLNGGAGNDVIFGGTGNDAIIGGAGVDKFVFNKPAFAGGTDFLNDFARNDVIVLDNDMFRGIGGAGKLAASAFKRIESGMIDANDRILYSQSSGGLFYDPDGRGIKAAVLFAVLPNGTPLSAGDFQIIN